MGAIEKITAIPKNTKLDLNLIPNRSAINSPNQTAFFPITNEKTKMPKPFP